MADFKPSHSGVGELLRSPEMELLMIRQANRIRDRAIAIAPVGIESDPHRGRYKASFHIRSSRRGGATYDRAEAIVFNDAPEAQYVEWGQHGREPYHTLLTAAAESRIP